MSSMFIVFMTFFITIMFFNYFNRNKEEISKFSVFIFWVLSVSVSFLIMKLSKTEGGLTELFSTSIICSMFNYAYACGRIKRNNVTRSMIVITLFFFSSLFQLFILPFLNYDINNLSPNENLILTTFSDGVLLIILISTYFKELKIDFKKIKGNVNRFMDIAIKYWLVGLLVMVCSNLLINRLTPAKAVNEESVQEIISSVKYISIITIGIIAPIIEEFIFRKAFKDVFKSGLAFILTSGLIFGGLHVVLSFNSLWDFLYIIPYSALGISFAAMYYKTDCIYTSIIMHMFHNTVLTTLSIISLGVIL